MQPFRTNKIDQPSRVGDNAKRMQDVLDSVNWKRLIRYGICLWFAFLFMVFSTIVVIRLALSLF